jgi:alpha-tubulin suppressor-like RCC1 family protein
VLSDWFNVAAEDWGSWQSKVMAAATGEFHSAAVGEDGALFVWGYGFCGQLEMGDTQLPVLPAPQGVAACPSCPSSPRPKV